VSDLIGDVAEPPGGAASAARLPALDAAERACERSDPYDLYDWSAFETRPVAPRVTTRRGSLVLAAALWAVDDVVLGEKRSDPVVEEMPVPTADPDGRVVVHLVWGEPRLGWARVRDAGW
jgi:hypothetical protein